MIKKFFLLITCMFLVGCNSKEKQIDEFKEISYNVPSVFKKDDDYTFSKYYDYEENNVNCTISFSASDKSIYKNKEDWFKGTFTFTLNDKVSDLKEEEINGNKVLFIEKKSEKVTDYYYGFESTNYYYLINYNIYDYKDGDREDIDTNKCFTLRENIISSVKLK